MHNFTASVILASSLFIKHNFGKIPCPADCIELQQICLRFYQYHVFTHITKDRREIGIKALPKGVEKLSPHYLSSACHIMSLLSLWSVHTPRLKILHCFPMKIEDILNNHLQQLDHPRLAAEVILILSEHWNMFANSLVGVHQSIERFMKSTCCLTS